MPTKRNRNKKMLTTKALGNKVDSLAPLLDRLAKDQNSLIGLIEAQNSLTVRMLASLEKIIEALSGQKNAICDLRIQLQEILYNECEGGRDGYFH